MPLKSYNKKIDHDLGIPLEDDYFYEDPEEIIENKSRFFIINVLCFQLWK